MEWDTMGWTVCCSSCIVSTYMICYILIESMNELCPRFVCVLL